MQKAIPKHRPAKNPASQKAKQSPTKNRFKFQNNNPKTGRRALARCPVFGLRALARRVVVLKFVSIFCWTLPGFLAGWILCWPMLWDGFLHGCLPPLIFEIDFWIDLWNSIFVFPNFSKVSCQKHFFGERIMIHILC